ncbi:acetyl-CoA carboxylase biotin carboxyl carrier protein subunit [Bacteroidota bacterium]
MEINIDDRSVQMEIISKNDNHVVVKIDNKEYIMDIIQMEDGSYSIIKDGRSYNLEIIKDKDHRNYKVTASNKSYKVEIVDAHSKYKKSQQGNDIVEEAKIIVSPMPGKVVRILVNKGDPVEPGQTLIIVSAMKMESEYKARISGKVSEIAVNEGDSVEGNQVMIKLSD